MKTTISIFGLSAAALLLLAATSLDARSLNVTGGSVELVIDPMVARAFDWPVTEGSQGENRYELKIHPGGTLDAQIRDGDFPVYSAGVMVLSTQTPDSAIAARLQPSGRDDQTLAITDEQGTPLLTLELGHHELGQLQLRAHAMDVRLTPAGAERMGRAALAGNAVGFAHLNARLGNSVDRLIDQFAPKGNQVASCSEATWPGDNGAVADLEFTDISQVDELRFDSTIPEGLVVITPTAEFRNIGSADLPWFQAFITPELDPMFCCDDGSGGCAPYGNDQQGYLVWALYKLDADGALAQIARSGVKHAFNSINIACEQAGGRIVWTGCEDFYSTGTNAAQQFLGFRDKIEPFDVIWNSCNSAFDADCDDVCDDFATNRFVKCNAARPGGVERRLSVADEMLTDSQARYFLDAWYLVRDDVDIFNSMGNVEIVPTLIEMNESEMWDFPTADSFQIGTVLQRLADEKPLSVERIDTGRGSVETGWQVDDLGNGDYRYHLSIMNYNVATPFNEVIIPVEPGVNVSDFLILGDDSLIGAWTGAIVNNEVRFEHTGGQPIEWGVMATFAFVADLPPQPGSSATVVNSASERTLQLPAMRAGLFDSGFESD